MQQSKILKFAAGELPVKLQASNHCTCPINLNILFATYENQTALQTASTISCLLTVLSTRSLFCFIYTT